MTSLKPVGTLSPTTVEHLLACPLRLTHGWVGAGDGRRSARAAIGLIAHDLSAQVYRGEHDAAVDPKAELEREWDRLAALQHRKMISAGADLPAPDLWPSHGLARTRLTRQLVRVVDARRLGASPEILAVEMHLRDEALGLHGVVDRVERGGDGVVVIDLKSGWEGEVPSAAYRRQILIYAHLWHVSSGEWPSLGAVEALNGRQQVFRVDADEVAALVGQVVSARDDVNAVIRSGASPHEVARPGVESCRFCPHRAWCGPQWDAVTADWDEYLASFSGRVTGVGDGGPITLEVAASNRDEVGATVSLLGVSMPDGASVGTHLAVVDAQPTHSDRAYRSSGLSTVVVIRDVLT